MKALACLALALLACCSARMAREQCASREIGVAESEAEARSVLKRFLDAAEAGDFEAAYGMLAGSWRAKYTPERFAADFAGEPLARERMARARIALEGRPVFDGEVTTFPVGDGRAVKLIREDGAFKVLAIE